MQNNELDLSVVLPAFEEARNLELLIPALQQSLQSLGARCEIVVIDTQQARDDSAEVCARFGAKYQPRIGGEFYGHAIRTAQEAAHGKYIIFMDADGSHSPGFVPKLWNEREHADIVIASRYVDGGHTDNPAILIFMSLAVNVVFRYVLGLKCADVSNSFRLYRGDDFRGLTLECDNFDIVEEILVKLYFSRRGYVVKEVPFTFEQRKAGKTKRKLLVFAFGYIGTLAKLLRLKRQLTAQKRRTLA